MWGGLLLVLGSVELIVGARRLRRDDATWRAVVGLTAGLAAVAGA
jgi:hypothetical protein